MSIKDKVVWSEGMFLRPHHFQQFERFLEHNLRVRIESITSVFWGFQDLDIDMDALALGKIALKKATGLFPDGTPFSFDAESAPFALEVPAGTLDKRVYLAIPRVREGAEDVVFEETPDSLARYSVIEDEVVDTCEVSLGTAVVQVGRLRFRLMLESDFGDEWIGMPLAWITERSADNKVVLDFTYIAPVLSSNVSFALTGFIRELFGLLNARSELLAARLNQPGRGGVAEVSEFLILETINRYRGALWHMITLGNVHPERIFHDFLMLASDLATFTGAGKRMETFPAYVHDNL